MARAPTELAVTCPRREALLADSGIGGGAGGSGAGGGVLGAVSRQLQASGPAGGDQQPQFRSAGALPHPPRRKGDRQSLGLRPSRFCVTSAGSPFYLQFPRGRYRPHLHLRPDRLGQDGGAELHAGPAGEAAAPAGVHRQGSRRRDLRARLRRDLSGPEDGRVPTGFAPFKALDYAQPANRAFLSAWCASLATPPDVGSPPKKIERSKRPSLSPWRP